ncbi:MAG: HD-GYP domain-containing protein [Syntrophales bacterium]|nr:HD-GYP domain-containing protein [Syntrophales bacterium]
MRNISHAEEHRSHHSKVLRKQIEDMERMKAENHQQLAMEILKLLNQPKETKDMITRLFRKIQEHTGIEAAGIRLREGGDYPYFSTNGFPRRFVELENYLCNRGPDGQIILDTQGNPSLECMCGNVIMKRTDPALPFFTEHGSFWTNSTSELLTSTTEKDRQSTIQSRCNSEGYESVALIPLYADKEIIGLLQLNDKRTDRFTLDFLRFLEEIGGCIGIAFEQQRRVDQVRKALGAAVQAIAAMVERKDPYTAGHQRRVAELARVVATEMGLGADQIDGLQVASVIHDIGKISVPAEILSKPTELTNIEFSLIKTHPQAGYDILKDMEFPWPVARMVLEHHERINGSGYPQGLTGGQALIESRILAIADVVESMASHRPYRAALGIDAALEEIKSNKGILYDLQAVDACLKVFTEQGFTWTVQTNPDV